MEDNGRDIVEKPKGRAGVLAKYKKEYPDRVEDPTDDELWSYAGGQYDDIKGNYRKNIESQKALSEYLTRDPRLGAALSMSIGEGEDKIPFPQALGRAYGKDIFLDDDEFNKGFEEFNAKSKKDREDLEKAQQNFENLTLPRLEKYAKDNNLSDSQINDISEGLMELADGMFMGDIPESAIDMVYKGLNYDVDVQEAATTGEIEGKNSKIKAEIKKRIPEDGVVDMGAGTGAMGQKEAIRNREKKNFFDNIK